MAHLAMHDAVQAFERRDEPYCVAVSNASGSPVAAASKAARDVLAGLFPTQTAAIDTAYTSGPCRWRAHDLPDTFARFPGRDQGANRFSPDYS